MKTKLYSAYGCDVYDESGRLFVYFDSGESAGSRLLKAEIDLAAFEKLKQSESEAAKVILQSTPIRLTEAEEYEIGLRDGRSYPPYMPN